MATTTLRPDLPTAVLLLASVGWGLSWLPLKLFGDRGVSGVPLVLVAYAAGAVVMGLYLATRRPPLARGEGRFLLAIAVLGGYANLAFVTALVYGEVVRVMVLFYLLPVWGVAGGWALLGEPIDRQRWIALVLAVTGGALVLGGPEVVRGGLSWPDLLALTCGMAFALNNIVFRARQGIPVASKVGAMFAGCAAIAALLILAGIQGWPQTGPATWATVGAFGVGWILLATLGTQYGVTHMEAGRASILIILELITAVVSATLIGGETMTPGEWAGALLILAAAVIEGAKGDGGESVTGKA